MAHKHRQFSDVLNWDLLVAPGVISCRDGSMIAGWDVRGIDTETMEEVEIEAWLDQLAGAMATLGDGEALRVVRKRRPYRRSSPPPWQAASSDRDPDQGGKHTHDTGGGALDVLFLEQDAILSATGYLWEDTITLYYHRTVQDGARDTVASFEAACRDIEDRLGGVLAMRRLGPVVVGDGGRPAVALAAGDFVALPGRVPPPCTASLTAGSPPGLPVGKPAVDIDATGRKLSTWTSCELTSSLIGLLGLPERPVRIDPDDFPMPLDYLIAFGVEQPDRHGPGRIEDRPAALLALEGFSDKGVNTGGLARIQSRPLEFTWVVSYGALSPATMRKRARIKQRFWRQSGADMGANIIGENEGRRGRFEDRMAANIEDTLERVSGGETGYGECASYMLITGDEGKSDSTIEQTLRDLEQAIKAVGIGVRRETVNFVPALLSLLPGHEGMDPRAFDIRADNAVALMPLRSIWQGDATCPSPHLPPDTPALLRARAQTGEAVDFNLHCGDLGHGLVFGPTGAGKSVLLGLLAAAFLRYPNAQVIYFDRQRSIAHACAALGGSFMELGGDVGGAAGIAPLAHLRELGHGWGTDWVTTLVRLQGVEPDHAMRMELRAAVDSAMNEDRPDMSGLLSYVQIQPLRDAIEAFLPGKTYGNLFSQDRLFAMAPGPQTTGTDPNAGTYPGAGTGVLASTDPLAAGNPPGSAGSGVLAGTAVGAPTGVDVSTLSAFETHALMEGPEIVRVLALDYVFAQVQRRFDGRPTLVVFDEAWSFFSHPLFVERIRSWLKEGRKNNVGVLMATQSLTDAIRSELTTELMESCPTRIFLPNAAAESAQVAQHYRALGLIEPEIAQIARMRSKRDYYVTQPEGRRVLAFPLGHIGLSILGRTSAADSRRALEQAGTNPAFWMEEMDDAFRKMGAPDNEPGGIAHSGGSAHSAVRARTGTNGLPGTSGHESGTGDHEPQPDHDPHGKPVLRGDGLDNGSAPQCAPAPVETSTPEPGNERPRDAAR